LKAWKVLSDSNQILDPLLEFEYFYTQMITSEKLVDIFEKLKQEHVVFSLFLQENRSLIRLDSDLLVVLMNAIKANELTTSVNDAFFSTNALEKIYKTSNQVVQLGVELLSPENDVYLPFANNFAVAYFTDQTVFAESQRQEHLLIAELIKIIDKRDIVFELADTLERPAFTDPKASHLLRQFDAVISFPPFNQKGKLNLSKEKFNRYKYYRGSNLNVAQVEHILMQSSGKAVVLLPVGFAYRTGPEEELRQSLIEKNWLEAIIQLPPNLHSATSIETTFFVLNKQKKENSVYFMSLKDDRFLKRDGRKIVLSDVDEIVDLYRNRKEIDNISILVPNSEIKSNNCSFAVDRYVISKEAASLQEQLKGYELVELQSLAEIRRSQLLKDEEEGTEVLEFSPSDMPQAGFTQKSNKVKFIDKQWNKFETYRLRPYDILLSTKGTIGKVGILGDSDQLMLASQAMQVIRLKEGEDLKSRAVILYMFLKSDLGQGMLKQLVAGTAMPQIPTAEIKKLQIPVLSKEEREHILENFNTEISMYKKIEETISKIKQIHHSYLGADK
jgi:type I restriction enzyme M protein